MDRQTLNHPEILKLIRLSDASRSRLESDAATLRHRLDVPARLLTSLKTHPSAWLLGSLGSGFAASLLFRRKPAMPEKKHRGIKSALLGMAIAAARPLLKTWLTGQLRHWTTGLTVTPNGNIPARASLQPSNHANTSHVHS